MRTYFDLKSKLPVVINPPTSKISFANLCLPGNLIHVVALALAQAGQVAAEPENHNVEENR
jgi:hypothetical protein